MSDETAAPQAPAEAFNAAPNEFVLMENPEVVLGSPSDFAAEAQQTTADPSATPIEGAGDPAATDSLPAAPSVAAPVSPATPSQDPLLSEIANAVKALADIQARQNAPAPPPPPEPSLLDRFRADADFRSALLSQYGFDPASPRDILTMQSLLTQKALEDQAAADRAAFQQYVAQTQAQLHAAQAETAFGAATSAFEQLPEVTANALKSAVIAMVQQGHSPQAAVSAILEPFKPLLRPRGTPVPASAQPSAAVAQNTRRPIDLAAARAAASRNGAGTRNIQTDANGRPVKGALTKALEQMEGYRGWG